MPSDFDRQFAEVYDFLQERLDRHYNAVARIVPTPAADGSEVDIIASCLGGLTFDPVLAKCCRTDARGSPWTI